MFSQQDKIVDIPYFTDSGKQLTLPQRVAFNRLHKNILSKVKHELVLACIDPDDLMRNAYSRTIYNIYLTLNGLQDTYFEREKYIAEHGYMFDGSGAVVKAEVEEFTDLPFDALHMFSDGLIFVGFRLGRDKFVYK